MKYKKLLFSAFAFLVFATPFVATEGANALTARPWNYNSWISETFSNKVSQISTWFTANTTNRGSLLIAPWDNPNYSLWTEAEQKSAQRDWQFVERRVTDSDDVIVVNDRVKNSHATREYFIPGKTDTEWQRCRAAILAGQVPDLSIDENSIACAPIGLTSIVASDFHSCALDSTGSAWCWGYEDHGRLGNGLDSGSNKATPVAVLGGHTFTGLAEGDPDAHTCALKEDGQAYCWGHNQYGKLGDGSSTHRSSPTAVLGGHTFTMISTGNFNTCALDTSGSAYCWGRGANGANGDGTTTQRNTPRAVAGGHTFTMISTGRLYACGIKDDNTAWCWGYNNYGQLGDGSSTNRTSPRAVTGGHNFKYIAAGEFATCAIKTDDTIMCWGRGTYGNLGNASTSNRNYPVAINTAQTFSDVVVGEHHACAISATDSTRWCWGYNGNRQLGDGTTTQKTSPIQIGSETWSSVSAGYQHSCGITSDGVGMCWGENNNGRIGDSTTTDRSTPTSVSGGHTFGVTTEECSGGVTAGCVNIPGATSFQMGTYHTCAIDDSGVMHCWGRNNRGQLGDGTRTNRNVPTEVDGGHTWKTVATGYELSCAIKSDNTLWCFGRNQNGQLGDNSTTNRTSPTQVSGGGIWTDVEMGYYNACATQASGTKYCWGNNGYGQVGDGTTTQRTVPTQLTDGTFEEIVSSYRMTCGRKADDMIYCWGINDRGQVGDGTTTQRTSPVASTGGFIIADSSEICGGVCSGESDWYDSSWASRKEVVISASVTSANLTNFPVLVSISSDSDLSAGAQSNGNDILFTNSAGTKLDHEIERYSNGTLTAWVKVPSLSSSADTTLYMYFENSGASNQENPSGVWDSNFEAVYHLAENPATSTDGDCGGGNKEVCDSTSNSNDGDTTGLGSGDLVSGKIGSGYDFDGSVSPDYIDVPNSTSLNITGNQVTLEAWAKPVVSQPQDSPFLVKGSTMNQERYMLGIDGGVNPGRINNRITTSYHSRHDDGALSNNVWTHLVMVYNGSNKIIYKDGVQIASHGVSGNISASTAPLLIGRRVYGDNRYYTGDMDELRVSSTARSPQWIQASYNIQNSPGSYLTIGSKEEDSVQNEY